MKLSFTAKEIASLIDGRVEGDGTATVVSVAKIEEGRGDALSFIANPKYESYAATTLAGVLLVNETLPVNNPAVKAVIRVNDPYMAFTRLLEFYQKQLNGTKNIKSGISQKAVIEESTTIGSNTTVGALTYIGNKVTIGNNVCIYPNVYIGDHCIIGDNTILYAGVKLYENSQVGAACILHSGAVIGSDGFGFAPKADGSWQKIPQTGNVVIEDNVEIGANSCIDRATMGSTIIRKGVKLDNLIQIAHNVEIGENTAMAAQVGVSGSTKLGKNTLVGGQAAFTGHIKIADGAKIQARAAVKDNITQENAQLAGTPAINAREYYRQVAALKQLPDLLKRIHFLFKK